MEDSITAEVSKSIFRLWPFPNLFIDVTILVVLLILMALHIRKMRKDYTNNQSVNVINTDWIIFGVVIAVLLILVGINISKVHRSMTSASNISDDMTLNGKSLVVIPDFPSAATYLVLDENQTVAKLDTKGYHALNSKGKALYNLSNKIYNFRYSLKREQNDRMFGNSNRINKGSNGYYIFAWDSKGQQVKYVSNFDSTKISAHKDSLKGVSLVTDSDIHQHLSSVASKDN